MMLSLRFRPIRALFAVLLFLGAVSNFGCAAGAPGKGAAALFNLDERHEKKIAARAKRDSFPTAVQAGVASR